MSHSAKLGVLRLWIGSVAVIWSRYSESSVRRSQGDHLLRKIPNFVGHILLHSSVYEVDPTVTYLAFGCTKSLESAEVSVPTAAIQRA